MAQLIKLVFLSCFLLACTESNDPQPLVEKTVPAEKPTKLVLVTGVTGKQGGAVAYALLEKGYLVRGLTRNPDSERAKVMSTSGIEMVKGDFEDKESLDMAMVGAYGVYSVQNFWEHGYEGEIRQGKNVVDSAQKAGIKHLVYSSVANSDQATGIPHFESKYEVEQYIVSSGIPNTILRPVSFMENWEYARESIVAGKLSAPFSIGTRLQQISVRDIGRFAELAFSKPEDWLGRSLDIAGDEYSVNELVNIFSRVTASPVEYVQVPWEVYEQDQGEEMTIMDRWIENTGYSANINLVRSELVDMLSLEEYLEQRGW